MIICQCAQCKKRFQVEDRHAGKATKCPACGGPITVPSVSAQPQATPVKAVANPAPRAVPVQARQPSASVPKPVARPAARPVSAAAGVATPQRLPTPAAVPSAGYPSNSLMDLLESDLTSGPAIAMPQAPAAADVPGSSPLSTSYRGNVKKKKKKSFEFGNLSTFMYVLIGVGVVALLLLVGATNIQLAKIISGGLMMVAIGVCICCYIWYLVTVFKENVLIGILHFVPLIQNFIWIIALLQYDSPRKPFLYYFLALLLLIVLVIYFCAVVGTQNLPNAGRLQ
jgi:hypothetical protein